MDRLAKQWNDLWVSWLGGQSLLSRGFPLMDPVVVPVVCGLYLAFVGIGPMAVKGRPLSMKPAMRVYNVFMVVLSAYMGTMSLYQAYQAGYKQAFCVPYAGGKLGADMARLTWIFTFSKIIEFLDTVFMILEGRMRQVSFLHVYHHVTIFTYWFAITWMGPGSDAYFSLAINSYIHVIMYFYYFIASFDYKPWWKFLITYMQILQFASFAVQSIVVGYVKSCPFPSILARLLFWYMLSLIVLFSNFLIQNKFKKKRGSNMAQKVEKKKA